MRKPAKPKEPFSISLEFKPREPGGGLFPAERSLLIAYIGEILAEIEIEEQRIIEKQKISKG